MRVDDFLSPPDAGRIRRVLTKLNGLGLTSYAVTGGVALETAFGPNLGRQRPLNDIDLVIPNFEAIPADLGKNFLVRHVHPQRPQGKLVLQLVDVKEAVRVDFFGARGATLARARSAQIGNLEVKLVAIEDMASRLALEMMAFVRAEATPSKCAADYQRVASAVDPVLVETAWPDHRRTFDPDTFSEARVLIDGELKMGVSQLFKPTYSKHVGNSCIHCEESESFQLAKPTTIVSALGYY